jgi:transposase
MEVLYPRCAGLDVHKDTVVAAVRLARGSQVERDSVTFGTTTGELLTLLDWLQAHGITHVAMEATGVCWKPVWHVLAGHFELVLANAAHIRNVPGRKTDANDAQWIADLLAHGLIRGSFVPPEQIGELRDLTRTRKQLVRERGRHVQRIQKVLEDANIKLASVISDVMGMSGRSILEALIRGEDDPEKLVELTSRRLKAPGEQLVEALRGRVTGHHRFMLQVHLRQIGALDRTIGLLEDRTAEVPAPFRELIERLETIPGVSELTAHTILAEIGTEMERFPTADHLVSWAGLSPRQDESAGKRRSSRTRKGGWLKTALVQSAWAVVRTREGHLYAKFQRIRARRGGKKAVVAVAASILTAAYHMIQRGTDFQDLGADYYHRRSQAGHAYRLVQRLRELGYEVDLRAAA